MINLWKFEALLLLAKLRQKLANSNHSTNKETKMKRIILATILATQLAGCATSTQTSVAGVNRKQFLLLPESQVTAMSSQQYAQTLQTSSDKKLLNVNQAQLARVRTISNRLIAQTGTFRPDALKWKWEVNVEKNDQINAYCMPGGKIMVFTGLIEKLNATDDELAAVIGHEIAHALREHGRERMSTGLVQQIGLQGLAAIVTGGNAAAYEVAGTATNILFTLPNSRTQEQEADRMGLELAARAGYNPEAAISLWQKMGAQSAKKPPEFLSTHPSNENRIADLRKLTPQVMPLYLAAKKA